jgi:hypothetical protein
VITIPIKNITEVKMKKMKKRDTMCAKEERTNSTSPEQK